MIKRNPFSFPVDESAGTYDIEKATSDAAAKYIELRGTNKESESQEALDDLDRLIKTAPDSIRKRLESHRNQIVLDWDAQPEPNQNDFD
ncbi:hypothetical protein IPC1147_34160 [Pseudomonas aeruginosa]|uniref:hypothetical protein n=1 Tax=Pseudomonas aeruginosa TaxID=287 RepID=UPI000F530C5A|nr:hypothetical protein [Pseudomonas aeruginosa]MBA5106175.1 hypothetical protein [Pseudomonas aeruginosa]MBD1300203.1 hypothetical protein [Pseudomonas aeruginosa]MBD1340814.1 hypothetical protein [Pseudomonas aeruginosa]MBG4604219.1 hypothetical protein [Pseudomonas aeruginosa]MBH3592943.1 hypothetical protein [Pseudomonas aeruginosa]